MRTVDWRTLWEDHGEPGELRRVLCALANSMGGNGGQPPTNCSPSMQRIARRAGMRRDSASRWIREAERDGWINVGRKTGMRNRYYATVPKELTPLLPDADAKPQTKARKPATPKSADGPPCPVCKEPMAQDGSVATCGRCHRSWRWNSGWETV